MAIAFDTDLGNFSQNTSLNSISMTTTAPVAAGGRIFLFAFNNDAVIFAKEASGGNLKWEKIAHIKNGGFTINCFTARARTAIPSGTVFTVIFTDTGPTGLITALSFTGTEDIADNFSGIIGTTAGWGVSVITEEADTVAVACCITNSATASDVASAGTESGDFVAAFGLAMTTVYLISTSAGTKTIAGTWTNPGTETTALIVSWSNVASPPPAPKIDKLPVLPGTSTWGGK